MNKSKKADVTQIIRHIIQAISFVIFPGLFYLIYLAFKSIYMSVVSGSFSWMDSGSDIALLLAVVPITILWGRFFCGYLCSFGAIGELVYFLASKMRNKNPVIPKKIDRILKHVKYVVLVMLLIFVWSLGFTINASNNPLHVFGTIIRPADITSFKVLLSAGGVLLAIIIAGSAFVERMFCRYLCPVGAVFSLISKFRLFKIKRTSSHCAECGLCERKCPMGVKLSKATDRAITSGECIDCMRCLKACPANALSADPNPAVSGSAAAIMMTGLYYAGNVFSDSLYDLSSGKNIKDRTVVAESKETVETTIKITETGDAERITVEIPVSETTSGEKSEAITSETESEEKYISEIETTAVDTEAPDRGPYEDGVYEGYGEGYRGTTEVTVTVENGYITEIELVSKRDDSKFFNRAWEGIIDSILSEQSTDISTVCGATFSSKGIIQAVEDALGL